MSIEFGEVPGSSWKSAVAQPVAMAAAGALAFSLLVGSVAAREGSSPLTSARPQSRPALSFPAPSYKVLVQWPAVTIYVVGSEVEAREFEARLAGIATPDTGHTHEVFIADTPERVDLLLLMYFDLGQEGTTNVSIVDLR